MQTKKMSLANIQGKLSRTEMKKIMAGSADCSLAGCASDSDCGSKCKCAQGGTGKFCSSPA